MSTALYRRYRPETFAEVIGQEHVTAPLSAALARNRVSHAYLFSGPRGCGKTTSARILARCLNCSGPDPQEPTDAPTPVPCGVCDSCVALARGGPGSLDVIEIDAASHRGIDDAREIRERAVFAPASSRFKIFIIDEAHMVTKEGFNALLKIVEEPPEHVKFVFATTEPDKVIGTIRSRTHHYPFRLVPPGTLQDYLARVCDAEGVAVGRGVLPLVVRAGAGSVRDSLSVLDQLIAGSPGDEITYSVAVSLLGYTDATLLDSVVEALAAGDGATVFSAVDRVIESGHDPRRFVEDLLERLRDLLVVGAMPDAAQAVLRGAPEDQLDRMRVQASAFGRAELSRAADVANAALTEMTGATSPRLQLELLCARMLLPGADEGMRGLGARMDRLERRMQMAPATPPTGAPPGAAPHAATAPPPTAPRADSPSPSTGAPSPPPPPAALAGPSVESLRARWPEVLQALSTIKRTTWSLLSQHAQVLDYDGERMLLGFSSPGLVSAFGRGAHQEFLRQAVIDVLGIDVRFEAVGADRSSPSAQPSASSTPSPRPAPAVPVPVPVPAPEPAPQPAAEPAADRAPDPPPDHLPEPEPAPATRPARVLRPVPNPPPDDDIPPPTEPPDDPYDEPPPERPTRRSPAPVRRLSLVEDEPSLDDADIEGSSLVGAPVVEQLLGGRVIEERDE